MLKSLGPFAFWLLTSGTLILSAAASSARKLSEATSSESGAPCACHSVMAIPKLYPSCSNSEDLRETATATRCCTISERVTGTTQHNAFDYL